MLGHGGDRTHNLLIRSQTPCHWATRPGNCLMCSAQIIHKKPTTQLAQILNRNQISNFGLLRCMHTLIV